MFFDKMKAFIIPPLQYLDLMSFGEGNYFCLAHFYLKYPEYRKYFKEIRKQKGSFILLDNSAAERSLVTVDTLLKIVGELEPDEVIAPDILFDKNKTLKNLEEFTFLMEEFAYLQIKERTLLCTKVLGCPQGKTRREWLDCYFQMLENPMVSTIGLSKISVPFCWLGKTKDEGIKEARQECVEYLHSKGLIQKPLHLLGMGSPDEYKAYTHPLIRSTDSCYTILAAKHGIEFQKGNFKRIETTNDFYEEKLSKKAIQIAKANIKFLKSQFVERSI